MVVAGAGKIGRSLPLTQFSNFLLSSKSSAEDGEAEGGAEAGVSLKLTLYFCSLILTSTFKTGGGWGRGGYWG